MLSDRNELIAVVGGGWAVGRFTYSSKSKITCDRQAFLLELFLEYQDGSKEKIVTDESWQVTREGNYRFGDFYDGEIYDATVELNRISWKKPIFISRNYLRCLRCVTDLPSPHTKRCARFRLSPQKTGERPYTISDKIFQASCR